MTNTLVLGALPPGTYQFRFVADGVTVETVPIIVPQGTGQLLTAELALSQTALNLVVNGLPGVSYSIQASADLTDWIPIFTQAGSFTFTEAFTKNSRPRFYQVRIGD